MLLFAAGESGRSFTPAGRTPPSWAWWAFAIGLAFAIAHTMLAFALVHDWSHADAVRATAVQTQALYGIPVGGGLYVNYVFLGVWLADALWWRASPPGSRPAAATWTLRAFYMVIIFNAAVVAAAGYRRVMGALLVLWLARVWNASHAIPDR